VSGYYGVNGMLDYLDDATLTRLREQAARHGRSMEDEAAAIIRASIGNGSGDFREAAARCRDKLAGRSFADPVELIAEDRRR
jgi:plasmid stability protein